MFAFGGKVREEIVVILGKRLLRSVLYRMTTARVCKRIVQIRRTRQEYLAY